jgi:hypothetical protein
LSSQTADLHKVQHRPASDLLFSLNIIAGHYRVSGLVAEYCHCVPNEDPCSSFGTPSVVRERRANVSAFVTGGLPGARDFKWLGLLPQHTIYPYASGRRVPRQLPTPKTSQHFLPSRPAACFSSIQSILMRAGDAFDGDADPRSQPPLSLARLALRSRLAHQFIRTPFSSGSTPHPPHPLVHRR